MNKMTLERFREIKARLNWMFNLKEGETDLTEEELMAEYFSLENEILSSDLSDIPFEEWKGLQLSADGLLDFSKTHANLDFELLGDLYYETIDVRGCNVRNIQYIDYDETTFDKRFMDEHPEFFPGEEFPEEIRRAYYAKKLKLTDLIEYPGLAKYVKAPNFRGERYSTSFSRSFIKKLGLENTIKLIENYPELIKAIMPDENDHFSYPNINLEDDPELGDNPSYEAARRYLFTRVVEGLKNRYGFDVVKGNFSENGFEPYIYPDLVEMFPDVFIPDGIISKEALDAYYAGRMSISGVRKLYDTLIKYSLEMGTKHNNAVRVIKKLFGSLEKYFEEIPEELDPAFDFYLNDIYYRDDEIKQLMELSKEDLINVVIRNCIHDHNFYFSLEDALAYEKYIGLDSLIHDEKVRAFVQKVGLERLIEFNKAYKEIVEAKFSFNPFDRSMLSLVANNVDVANVEVNSIEDVAALFEKAIRALKAKNDYTLNEITSDKRELFEELYPSIFIKASAIKAVLPEIDEKELKEIIKNIEDGIYSNIGSLFRTLRKYPQIIDVIKDVELFINANYPLFRNIYSRVGTEKFLRFYICLPTNSDNVIRQMESEDVDKVIDCLASGNDPKAAVDDAIYKIIELSSRRSLDIRELPDSFKAKHPELYLPEDAPEELKTEFYGFNMSNYSSYIDILSAGKLQNHPEWIPYLVNLDLSKCLEKIYVTTVNGRKNKVNLIDVLLKKLSNEDLLNFLCQYGKMLEKVAGRYSLELLLNPESSKEEMLSDLLVKFVYAIQKDNVMYDETLFPVDFKNIHPEFFLREDAPNELHNKFYKKELTPEMIKRNPEWIPYLLEVDFILGFQGFSVQFIEGALKLGKKETLDLMAEYGKYITLYNLFVAKDVESMEEIKRNFENMIVSSIRTGKCTVYDEDLRDLVHGEDDLFLDEDAPEELKDCFYNRGSSNYFTFAVLKQHRDWLPFLKGKEILPALIRGIRNIEPNYTKDLIALFNKYGTVEALNIGLKNPESVHHMLYNHQLDLLSTWYDRLHFVPHYCVMEILPVDYIDKFAASGKFWSQIMRLEGYNESAEVIAALVRASFAFGVFDGDKYGFNRLIQLFSDVPRTLTEEEYQKASEYCIINEDKADDDILSKAYAQSGDGSYVLTIDPQQNKETIKVLRRVFEKTLDRVMTPNKAHNLFGGFELINDPSFRDFFLENIDLILSTSDYIMNIVNIQKQWKEIKKVNSNRTLTFDLAYAYIKVNAYENIEPGNTELSEEVKIENYSQADFEILQQIFNYGRLRTFSSIPRVEFTENGYQCEIVRLDSPIPLVIGPRSECCQRLHREAQTSMEHSMTSKHGRLFVITDEGGTVAQSWVWRNKNVICFDNIEIPDDAFKRANKKGLSNAALADLVFDLYRKAAEEMIKIDQEKYKELLEQGLITEEQYHALVATKVTVGLGWNDVEEAIRRNAKTNTDVLLEPTRDRSHVSDPSDYLYISDSREQYVVTGEGKTYTGPEEALSLYSDKYVVYDDSNFTAKELLMLNKLELATKEDSYDINTQVYSKENLVSSIAWNYGLNPKNTRIIMCPTFAIIFEEKEDEIVIADLFYNMKVNVRDIDVMAKIVIQIRNALDQIKNGKTFNTSGLDENQMKIFILATGLKDELDIERGLSHGNN